MAGANVLFEATLAVGFSGIAVLKITERPAPGFVFDGEPDCVKDHICESGAEEWWEWLPDEKPAEPGIYRLDGSAWFSEDDAGYTNLKFEEI